MAELTGHCTCSALQYQLLHTPLFTHCCHCTWCQRETGTAFVLNALIETRYLDVLTGVPQPVDTPSASGKGQVVHRCPICQVALWSTYSGMGPRFSFVRVGTLDAPELCPPDIHIFTSTKLPWLILDDACPVREGYYRRSEFWPAESLARREAELALR
ncbi:MAG: GFA family protein [Pseudomonadota bacterium]